MNSVQSSITDYIPDEIAGGGIDDTRNGGDVIKISMAGLPELAGLRGYGIRFQQSRLQTDLTKQTANGDFEQELMVDWLVAVLPFNLKSQEASQRGSAVLQCAV